MNSLYVGFPGFKPRGLTCKAKAIADFSFENPWLVFFMPSNVVFILCIDAVSCCAVMSINIVAFLLLHDHRKVRSAIFAFSTVLTRVENIHEVIPERL